MVAPSLRSVAEPPDYVRREFHEYESTFGSSVPGLFSRTSCSYGIFPSILLFRSYDSVPSLLLLFPPVFRIYIYESLIKGNNCVNFLPFQFRENRPNYFANLCTRNSFPFESRSIENREKKREEIFCLSKKEEEEEKKGEMRAGQGLIRWTRHLYGLSSE